MKKTLVAALALSAASLAYADTSSSSGFYLGGGISSTKNDSDSNTYQPLELFGGYKLSPYVGGEIRAGASSSDTAEISNFESVYYRTESANSVGKTYLLLGYTHANLDRQSGNYSLSGVSYGAGVGFIINDYFNLNLEYKILVDGSGTHHVDQASDESVDMKLTSVSVTVDYRF